MKRDLDLIREMLLFIIFSTGVFWALFTFYFSKWFL
jgi:hypothetical protein